MRHLLSALAFLFLLAPAPASAEFHLLSIREVFPGDGAQPEAQYVELQAYAPGQQFVAGHFLTFRNASGAVVATESFAKDAGQGPNQFTIVMATTAAETRFGIAADASMPVNTVGPSGGAICWEAIDCVSWGNFAGALPSPAGRPAAPAGIPAGMALRRTIEPGCATLLEPGDDTNDSAADFTAVFPSPRPNSMMPSESACGPAAAGQAGQGTREGKAGAPQTHLRRRPPQRSRDRTPTFRFRSAAPGVSFECKLDRRPFRACRSPFTARRLAYGPHSFRVRARDAAGLLDTTPAFDAFRVVRRLN
jgi:hypothetical protein